MRFDLTYGRRIGIPGDLRFQTLILALALIPASFGSPLVTVAFTYCRISMGATVGPVFSWDVIRLCWAVSLGVYAAMMLACVVLCNLRWELPASIVLAGIRNGLIAATSALALFTVFNFLLIDNPNLLVMLAIFSLGGVVILAPLFFALGTIVPVAQFAHSVIITCNAEVKESRQVGMVRQLALLLCIAGATVGLFYGAYTGIKFPSGPGRTETHGR